MAGIRIILEDNDEGERTELGSGVYELGTESSNGTINRLKRR